MRGEIIAIGDELTSGRVINSTSCFAAAKLFAAGCELRVLSTIGDDRALIITTLRQALERSDFVIVTGGLGATSDDLTNEAVNEALGRELVFYPEILRKIIANSKHLSCQAKTALEKLAWLPAGAHALHSEARSAGYFLVHQGKPVFFLPGVPHEMRALLVDAVLPRLAVWDNQLPPPQVRQRLYRVSGLSEEEINRRLADLERRDARVKIGYYPVLPEVQVSLTIRIAALAEATAISSALVSPEAVGARDLGSKSSDPSSETMTRSAETMTRSAETTVRFSEIATAMATEADQLLNFFDAEINHLLGRNIYGLAEDSLAEVVGSLCRELGLSLAVAESCSGGLIAATVTRVPGASVYFRGAVVAYSNDLKENLLGVKPATLMAHGAVSAAVAQEMALGVRRISGADLALAVTGIAGPGGGSSEKPVGTVFIGLAAGEMVPNGAKALVEPRFFTGNRQQIQESTAHSALDLLRRFLLSNQD